MDIRTGCLITGVIPESKRFSRLDGISLAYYYKTGRYGDSQEVIEFIKCEYGMMEEDIWYFIYGWDSRRDVEGRNEYFDAGRSLYRELSQGRITS